MKKIVVIALIATMLIGMWSSLHARARKPRSNFLILPLLKIQVWFQWPTLHTAPAPEATPQVQ